MRGADAPSAESARAPIPVDPVGAVTLAARIGRREYPLLLLLWLPALAVELAAGALAAATMGGTAPPLGVAGSLLLLMLVARLATWTFASARVLDVALGGRRLARWRALVGPALLAGLALALAYAAGVLLLVVGFLVLLHWLLYVPTFVAQGERLPSAFASSRRFARERRAYGFTALAALLLAAVYGAYLALDALPGWRGTVVPALLLWATGPLVPLLAASYVALSMRGRPDAAAVAPDAAARTTTRCPQCGALVPYAPSASGPVEVKCPACGRAGRVL